MYFLQRTSEGSTSVGEDKHPDLSVWQEQSLLVFSNNFQMQQNTLDGIAAASILVRFHNES